MPLLIINHDSEGWGAASSGRLGSFMKNLTCVRDIFYKACHLENVFFSAKFLKRLYNFWSTQLLL